MNILHEIVENKKRELEALKARVPLSTIREQALAFLPEAKRGRRPFQSLFENPVLIAEIKPKSPSIGTILVQSPLDMAAVYAKSAADVISVLTDNKYFGGDIELLRSVRDRVSQTIFRKDFIIDEYQLYETLLAGADAYLLIASILSTDELVSLIETGRALGLDTLVEVHTEEELQKALAAAAPLIGINNRNLDTLETDLVTTEQLAPHIPAAIPFVSESGISTAADAARVRAAGSRGILVGTSILQSADPVAKIAELKKSLV